MSSKWQMRDARAHFGKLQCRAMSDGPQVVTRRGEDVVVVLSMEDYTLMQARKPTFIEHILSGPKLDDEIVDMINERPRDYGRDTDLE